MVQTVSFDFDLDGTTDREDCAPEDPAIPSPEACDNGIDDDCNGLVDQADDACGPVLRPPESDAYSALLFLSTSDETAFGAEPAYEATLTAFLTEASARRPDAWLPDLGECLSGIDVFFGPETRADHPIGSWLTVEGPSLDFTVHEAAPGYLTGSFPLSQPLAPDADYSVFASFEQGDQLFPLWLPDALTTPQPMASIIPSSLATASFAHTLRLSSDNRFQWAVADAESESYVLIDFIPYTSQDYQVAVRCRVEDSGLAFIDGGELEILGPGADLRVTLTRFLTREAVLPHDGSTALLIGSSGVSGTANLQP